MKRPLDTTEEADRIQFQIWRSMSADEKVRRILEWSDLLRTTFEDGIRDRHPEYRENDVRLARIRHELGDDLFEQAYPGERMLEP